jgi:hypothetical protein
MTSTGRVARLTALALATGTLVAAGAGTAGAASKTTTTYTANGAGRVVDLNINLPLALPTIGSSITQSLVSTASNVRTSGPGASPAAITTAVLGSNGNIPVVSQLLAKSTKSTYGGQTDAEQGGFPANALISGGVLNLKSLTANPDVANLAPVAQSLSSLVNLKIDGGTAVQQVINQVLSQVTSTLEGVIGTTAEGDSVAAPVAGLTQVTGLLNQLVGNLPVLAGSDASQQVQNLVNQVSALLKQLPLALSKQISATTEDTSLLKIGVIESLQDVTHSVNAVTSTASEKILGVSLLGGLVKVDSLTSEAVASLGKNGAAPSASGHADILNVKVADLLSLQVTSQLKAILSSGVLPAEVVSAVNQALDAVTTIVKSALGVVFTSGEVKKSATSDRAFAEASAAHLKIQPVGFAKPLVDIALVPATAEVVKAQSTTPTTVITPGKTTSRHQFAPTGANFGLTAPIAISLMGIALYARRRRLALQG